jgi:hypothetical protein
MAASASRLARLVSGIQALQQLAAAMTARA